MWLLRALRVAAFLTPIVPSAVGYWLCRLYAALFYTLKFRARQQVLGNLRQVEPGQSWFMRQQQAFRVFNTVVTNYYDLLRLHSMSPDYLLELVEVEGHHHLECALANGRGVIVFSAHLGNFNVMARYPAVFGAKAAIVAERVEPPELFQYKASLRSAMGITIIPPGGEAVAPILRVLRQNGVILLAGDRDINGQGYKVEFFRRSASLPVGPVLLARLTGAIVLPAYTLRTSDHRSVLVIEPPLPLIHTADRSNDLRVNMEIVARCLERMVSTDPGQWAILQSIWGDPLDHVKDGDDSPDIVSPRPIEPECESLRQTDLVETTRR